MLFLYFTVLVEATESGVVETASWKLHGLGQGTIIKNLILTVKQTAHGADIGVFNECDELGTKHMPTSLVNMLDRMKNPELQLVSI